MIANSLLRGCCCLRRSSKNSFPLNPPESLISLDSGHIGKTIQIFAMLMFSYIPICFLGQEVVILKNGKRVCGSGGAVLNQALLQSKSYFEVKIQQSGHWSVGLCTLNTDLNKTRGGLDKFSWCLNAENYVMNDGQVMYDLNEIYSSSSGNGNVNDDTEQLLPINNKQDISNLVPSSSNTSQRSALPQEGDIIGK